MRIPKQPPACLALGSPQTVHLVPIEGGASSCSIITAAYSTGSTSRGRIAGIWSGVDLQYHHEQPRSSAALGGRFGYRRLEGGANSRASAS